jgi:hypothetical protein
VATAAASEECTEGCRAGSWTAACRGALAACRGGVASRRSRGKATSGSRCREPGTPGGHRQATAGGSCSTPASPAGALRRGAAGGRELRRGWWWPLRQLELSTAIGGRDGLCTLLNTSPFIEAWSDGEVKQTSTVFSGAHYVLASAVHSDLALVAISHITGVRLWRYERRASHRARFVNANLLIAM